MYSTPEDFLMPMRLIRTRGWTTSGDFCVASGMRRIPSYTTPADFVELMIRTLGGVASGGAFKMIRVTRKRSTFGRFVLLALTLRKNGESGNGPKGYHDGTFLLLTSSVRIRLIGPCLLPLSATRRPARMFSAVFSPCSGLDVAGDEGSDRTSS